MKSNKINFPAIVIFTLFLLVILSSCKFHTQLAQVFVTNPLKESDQFPEVVEIVSIDEGGQARSCSATFIRGNMLITAAHCVFDNHGDQIQEVFYIDSNGTAHSPRIYPSRAYNPNEPILDSIHFDLAILEFDTQISPHIATIAKAEPKIGDPIYLVGFGNTDSSSNLGGGKKNIGTNTIERVDSNISYIKGYSTETVPGVKAGISSVVGSGDSGGAMFNKQGHLLGVISAGVLISELDEIGQYKARGLIINIHQKTSRRILAAINSEICTGIPTKPEIGCLGELCPIQ